MSTSSIFLGSQLFLLQVEQYSIDSVKIKFSQDPQASNANIATDALNKNNYSFLGPGTVSAKSISYVAGDTQSFIVTLTAPLEEGIWTATVSNIQTPLSNPLTTPTSLTFEAKLNVAQPSIGQGANSQLPTNIIRKNISPAIKGKAVNALIEAIAKGDKYLSDLAISAFDQLYVSTASEKYLDRKVSDSGLIRPKNVGMSDEDFRELAISLNSDKVTLQALLKVLNIFYGDEVVRANISTTTDESWDIQEGDELFVDIDGKVVNVYFESSDFSTYGLAKANEVSAAITRAFQRSRLSAFAVPIKNTATGLNKITIFSGALGLRGTVRILGGKAQNKLLFPSLISTTQAIGTTWTVNNHVSLPAVAAGRTRFTWTAGADPQLYKVNEQDYVNVFGDNFNILNKGTFEIVDVVTGTNNYFEIDGNTGFSQVSVQTAVDDVKFFTPTNKTVRDNSPISFVAQGDDSYADIYLATTTKGVNRKIFEAAYVHDNAAISIQSKIKVSAMDRNTSNPGKVTITTSETHGINSGDRFWVSPGDTSTATKKFFGGYYTASIVTSNTIQYVDFGTATTTADISRMYVYPSFRKADGIAIIKTKTPHGLSDGDIIYTDSLKIHSNSLAKVYEDAASPSGHYSFYQLTKLRDGRVLKTGGADTFNLTYSNSSFLFELKSNLLLATPWSTATNMSSDRFHHTATLLNDGRVLVCGGNNGTSDLSSCEIYDPALNIWITVLSMSVARSGHTATKLNDGNILVTGGGSVVTEIFDVINNIWTTKTASPVNRIYGQATLLNDGMVLFTGGYDTVPSTPTDLTHMYNPFTDKWFTFPTMTTAVHGHKSFFIKKGSSGRVYVVGGTSNNTTGTGTIQVFDVVSKTWLLPSISGMIPAIWNFGADIDSDENIYVYGGQTGVTVLTQSIDSLIKYNSVLNDFETIYFNSLVASPGVWANSVVLLDGGILLGESRTSASAIKDNIVLLFNAHVTDTGDIVTKTSQGGGLNNIFQTDSLNATVFTYQTDQLKAGPITGDSNEIHKFKAQADSDHIGPYIFDTNSPPITSISTVLNQDIDAGRTYSSISVTSAANLADSGFVVFNFGKDGQLWPVKYLYVTSSPDPEAIYLDPSYVFPINIQTGANIALLKDILPVDIGSTIGLGAFYATDSASGRIALSNILDGIEGVGLDIRKTILYPSDIGLGNEGYPITGTKMSDKVYIWGNEEEKAKGKK